MKTNNREQKFPVKIQRGSVSVKIYRTPSHGLESFTLSYFQDGVRKRPTFATFEKAKQEAETVAIRLGNSDADVLTLTSADRAAYLRARQLLDPLNVSIEVAAAQFAEAKNRLGEVPLSQSVEFFIKRNPTRIEPKLVCEVGAEFLVAKKADGLSERYCESLRWALAKLNRRFNCNIGVVTGADIDEWLRGLGLAARTRNNLRNSVQAFFSFAKTRGYLPKDHDEIDSVPVMKDRGGVIEVLTATELVEILNCVGEGLISFITVAAFAGVRHAEIQRLDWKDIRFEDNIIEIHAGKAKTASRRTIPLLDNLQQWLLPHRQDSGLVCPYRNVAYELHMVTKRVNLKRRAAWAQANGVTPEELKRNEERARQPVTKPRVRGKQKGAVPPGAQTAQIEGWQAFEWKRNALRHSFVSYRVSQTQNVAQVALEAGNSPAKVFSNYRELVRPADAKAWFALTPGGDGKIVALPKLESDGQSLPTQVAAAG